MTKNASTFHNITEISICSLMEDISVCDRYHIPATHCTQGFLLPARKEGEKQNARANQRCRAAQRDSRPTLRDMVSMSHSDSSIFIRNVYSRVISLL
jgi:hypothetical protein